MITTLVLSASLLALFLMFRRSEAKQKQRDVEREKNEQVRRLTTEVDQLTNTLNGIYRVMPRHEFLRHPTTRSLILTTITLRERLIVERGTLDGEEEEIANLYRTLSIPEPDKARIH